MRAFITIFITTFFLSMISSFFDSTTDIAVAASDLPYKNYNADKIKTALGRPLTLEDCIGIALTMNISLSVAAEEFRKAQKSVSASNGAFFPVFTIDGSKERSEKETKELDTTTVKNFKNSVVTGRVEQTLFTGASLSASAELKTDVDSRSRGDLSQTENRDYAFSLTQPILRDAWPTVARSVVTTARHEQEKQGKEYYNQQLQTIFETKKAYYDVLLQQELVKVSLAAIQRDSTLYKVSRAKVKAKIATRRDVLSAEIQLANDRTTWIKSQTDYESSLDILKEVMGLPIELLVELSDATLGYEAVTIRDADVVRLMLKNNPTIHSAEITILNSKLQAKIAKNQLLPQLDLTATYSDNFESNEDADITSTGWNAAVTVSYPFLNREAGANAEIARLTVTQEEDRLLVLKRQITRECRGIIRTIYSNIEEIKSLQRSIEAAEQKVSFATSMFNLGRASNLDVTDSQEDLLNAQTQYITKLVDYNVQLALLESLTGKSIR